VIKLAMPCWELVQLCFKATLSERPPVEVLANVLNDLKKHVNSQEMVDAAPPVTSGSGSPRRIANRRSLSPSSLLGDDLEDNSFSASHVPTDL
jgi:hypothetical protein